MLSLRLAFLVWLTFLAIFAVGKLPHYRTNSPPRSARIRWDEYIDGAIMVSGCADDHRVNCDFHFYKSKFEFFDNKIFIGARCIYWYSNKHNNDTCWSVASETQKETDCENYIKFVQPHPLNSSRVVLCGTYSLYRACLVVSKNLLLEGSPEVKLHEIYAPNILSHKEAFFAGRASDDNLLSFMKNRDAMVLFSAAPSIESNSDYRISFINTSLNSGTNSSRMSLNTLQYVNNKESQFLQSVTHFDRTYFQTFVKARLLCQVESPGGAWRHQGRVFNYDRIMGGQLHHGTSVGSGTEWITDRVFYGAFSGHGLGPKGSAICVYNATRSPSGVKQDNHGFMDIFSGDYYRQGSPTPDANKDPFNCTDDPRPKEDALTHTLIHRPALPIYDAPMVILDGYVISKIAVDTTRIITRSGSDSETLTFGIQDVIFAAVDDGSIIKVYSDTSMPSVHTGSVPEAIYPEVIELSDRQPISDMVIKESDGEKYLYVVSYSNVYRLPLQRCGRYNSCNKCISSRDPYCFWDLSEERCGPLPQNVTSPANRFLQNLTHGSVDHIKCGEDTPPPALPPTTRTIPTSTSTQFSSSTAHPTTTPTPSNTPPNTGTASTPSADPIEVLTRGEDSASLLFFIIGTLFLIIGCSLALVSLIIICQTRRRCKNLPKDSESNTSSGLFAMKSPAANKQHTVSKSSTLTSEDVRNAGNLFTSGDHGNDSNNNDPVFTPNGTCNGNLATDTQSDNNSNNNNNNNEDNLFQESGIERHCDSPHVLAIRTVSGLQENEVHLEDRDSVPELRVMVPKVTVPTETMLMNPLKPCVSTEFDHLEAICQPSMMDRQVFDTDTNTDLSISEDVPISLSPFESQGSIMIGDFGMRSDSAA